MEVVPDFAVVLLMHFLKAVIGEIESMIEIFEGLGMLEYLCCFENGMTASILILGSMLEASLEPGEGDVARY